MRKIGCFVIITCFIFFSSDSKAFYGEQMCDWPEFHCVKLTKKGQGKDFWSDPRELEIIEKINRIHKWYFPGTLMLVPNDMKGKTYMDFSPYPKTLDEFKNSPDIYLELEEKNWKQILDMINKIPANEKVVIWAPELLAWAAYNEKDQLVNWGPALGGADHCEGKIGSCRTPSGIFEALTKKDLGYRSNLYPPGCKGEDCSWMPHSIKVREDGLSMHGSKWFAGKHASHGCVRLFLDDAKWLNQKFFDYKTKKHPGTKVVFLPYPKKH